ncbi:endonuclease [Lutibacter sp. A80]|uniref:endonuclease n=1 Tax=Lutibacter sp. A80 TaxID=2918453 RepID=UPI002739B88C|nr:endonuclease [Lutibacter sp. A80]
MKKTTLSILLFITIIPFYGQIQSYYLDLDLEKTGNELFLELSEKLESTHSAIPYTGPSIDVWEACRRADEDPDNADNVLLIYGYNDTDGIPNTDRSRDKDLKDTGGGDPERWNREHVFAKSLANPGLGTDEPGPGTDVHNLRPADSERNSDRSNRKFTDGSGNSGTVSSNGGWYPGDEWKGDIARIVMYMYTRYHGAGNQISQTNCLPINVGFGTTLTVDENMVDLFLKWNVEDPVSDFEANRNEVLAGIQGNRNPFIDNPYLATLIWGGLQAEDKWWSDNTSDNEAPTSPSNLITSNTTNESTVITWDASTDNVAIYDYLIYLNGEYLQSENSTTNSTIISGLNASTNYTVTIKARDVASNLSGEGEVSFTTLEGPYYLINEDFENCANVQFVAYNEESNKNWECSTVFGENNSGSYGMNGFNEDVTSKDWLITTSPINFDESTAEKLSFYTDAAYGSSTLELVYSSNYDGSSNPSDFTWTAMPNINIPTHSNGGSTEEVYSFSNVDISSITGTVYIAFKYYSNGSPTRWTVDSFEITAEISDDIDEDGVLNEDDLCPNTPAGEPVDENGCSNGQLDDDEDGVENSIDICPNTPEGESVDENGCSDSQLDDDIDGVMNNIDTCPDTPAGETVDENGCSDSQLDDDGDGVVNNVDTCPNTPEGETVDENGCSDSQLDDDNDGVMNNIDTCPDTPAGETVDENGCSDSQLDDDGDGVMNNIDLCENSTPGSSVNTSGCFTLPANNFSIQTISETCPDKNNGQILITAQEDYTYNVTLNGTAATLQNKDLEPGNYTICIEVAGEDYEQCFDVVIEEGTIISGKASVSSGKVSINISEGTAPFNVFVNDTLILQTLDSSFTINAKYGDSIQIKSSVTCEGVFSKNMNLVESITAYPNPTKGTFEIAVPVSQSTMKIEIYNTQSQLISTKNYEVVNGKVQLNLSNNTVGLYFAKVYLDSPVLLKIIKE